MIHPQRLLAALLLTALCLPSLPAREEAFTETFEDNRSFHLFGGPSRKGPEDQWERCQGFVEEGKLRKAIRHTRYLVETWPDHPRAVDAQRLHADLLFAREEYKAAFDAYQGLIDRFAGLFDYDEILAQQLECARKKQNKVYSSFFGLGSYEKPLEAIPLYRSILVNAPHIREAPEILHTIGEIYLDRKKYSEAVEEFTRLEQEFPESPFSESAALGRADAYRGMARKSPTDLRPKMAELAALDHFNQTYPESERIEDIRLRKKEVYDHLAQNRFEKGLFYEETLDEPAAAKVIYRSVLEQYPDSEWTAKAEARILSLSPTPQPEDP